MSSVNATVANMEDRYYAFISYKRADSKWANWLYHNLQNYRLPSKLCKKHKELPKRLSPVFLDTEDLIPGSLSETLRENIASSKYFISICSKNSQNNPQYIDMELQYFLETHDNDYKKIIPFIVDESPAPEKECFSPQMQKLCAEHDLIGTNVTESRKNGKHQAFLKVVAYMHGIYPKDLESLDSKRKKKNAILVSMSAAVCLCFCLLGLQYWWQHYALHEDYYINYIWVNNSVKGVGQIDEKELSNYSRYYLIKSIDGYPQSIAYMNYAETVLPLDEEATVLDQNASRIEFTYTGEKDDKRLYMAKFYDYNGLPIVCYQYSADGTHVTLLQDEISGVSGYVNQNVGVTGMFSDKINISRYVQEFDENGYMVKRFYAYGEDYTRMSDGNGVFGYELTYDKNGNAESVTYFANRDGSIVGESDGIATIRYTYDSNGIKLESLSYFDQNNTSVACAEGWAKKEYQWTEHNAIHSVSYKDVDDELILCQYGFATAQRLYDGIYYIGQKYFGCDGNPTTINDGYSFVEYKTDASGVIVYARYYDDSGNPTVNIGDGVYGYEIVFESDTEYYKKFVDVQGNPMMTKDGYAYIYVTADAFNYPLKQEFKDTSGNFCEDHYAWCTYSYDELYHNTNEHAFYDAQGNLITNPQLGAAAIIWEYDNHGRQTLLKYIGEDGNMCNGPYGYAKVSSFYEQEGTYFTEIQMFYDENDAPVIHKQLGAYGYECARYESGKLAGMYYLDENKYPYYTEENGFAGVNYLYDEYGYISYVSYFKSPFQAVMVDGCASVSLKHDEHGNLLECIYYDESDNIVVNPNEGCAAVMYSYDSNGNLSELHYFDENLEYMNNPIMNCAFAQLIYDQNGELIDEIFWVVENGELVQVK